MKALKFTAPKKYDYIEVETPRINDEQILVKVMATGICHSDIVAYNGKHPYRVPPVITGHECSGVVVSIGKQASGKFKKGDRVVIEPHIGCGSCYYCKRGRYNLCLSKRFIGVGDWIGCFAEYIAVYPSMCAKMPEKLTFQEGALVEPFSVGNHAVELAQLSPDSSVAVLGCGTIGMMTIVSLVNHGIKNIIGTDVSDDKQRIALTQGASYTFNPTNDDIVLSVLNVTNGIGVDAVFITSAFPGVMDQACDICRRFGKIIIVALFEDPFIFDFKKIQLGERTVIGSNMYTMKDYYYTLQEYKRGNLSLLPLLTKKISFDQAGAVIDGIAKGKYSNEIKIVIDYDLEENFI